MKLFFSVVICCFSVLNVFNAGAQDKVFDLPIVIPPSPNAASLGKFGDISIGGYTGIPDISIPIYTVKLGSFSLPISLRYHSQGLKVEEISNWIGLNWSLSTGGVITRSVHGNPDEGGTRSGYWNAANWTMDSVMTDFPKLINFCDGVYDMEVDMFYYNFGNKSGKFILDPKGTHDAHLIPFDNLKITHSSKLEQFEVTDDQGIKYLFDAKETTVSDNVAPAIRTFTSSWYLSKITTPEGDITFTYASETNTSIQLSEAQHLPSTYYDPVHCADLYNSSSLTSYIDVDSKVLTEINTPYEKIVFNLTGNRTDMPSANMLESIEVKDLNNITRNK